MANTYKGQYSSSIRGNVQPYDFTYHPISDSVFRAVSMVNDMYDKRDEALGNVTKAVNAVPLDHSEDAYRTHFIEKYTNLIKQNPYKAQEYANEAANDPEFQAKARAHQEHLAFENHLDDWAKNGTIDEITAERLKNHKDNQYKFTPTIENGRIVGGEKWEAGKQAVRHIPPTEILQMSRNFLTPKTTSNKTSRGGTTTNADGTGYGGQTSSGTETVILEPDKIRNVFNATFQALPGAEDSLKQDYEDDEYRLEKYTRLRDAATNDSERTKYDGLVKQVEKRLYNTDGSRKSVYEYMAASMNIIIDNSGIHNTATTSERISNVDNSAKTQQGQTYSLDDLDALGINTSSLRRANIKTVGGTVVYSENGYQLQDMRIISKIDENGKEVE